MVVHDEILEMEANRSDSGDDDYDDRGPAVSTSRKRKLARASKRSKRKRRRPFDDDEDLSTDELDEDDILDDTSPSDDSANIERTETGRPKRAVTKKTVTLRESSEEADDIDDNLEFQAPAKLNEHDQKASLLVILPAFIDRRGTIKVRKGGRRSRPLSSGIGQTRRLGTRRSSRQSNDGEFLELTGSGRHAKAIASRSATPEASTHRPVRSAKRVPGQSAIIEASQEDELQEQEETGRLAQASQAHDEDEEPIATQLTNDEDDIEHAVIAESPHSEHGEEHGKEGTDDEAFVEHPEDGDADDDEDEGPIRRGRTRKASAIDSPQRPVPPAAKRQKRAKYDDESDDFDPAAEDAEDEEELSGSQSPQKASQNSSSAAGKKRKRGAVNFSEDSLEIDNDEVVVEALARDRKKQTRSRLAANNEPLPPRRSRGPQPDYRIFKPEALPPSDDDQAAKTTSSNRGRRTAGPYRSLLSTMGPFGGAGGPPPIFGGPENAGAVGGADSDSSDDDLPARGPRGMGGAVGMTPTSALPSAMLPQSLNNDPAQGASGGGPANLGKVKDKKALADVDPLGVDTSVSFEGVGGLDNHINQLKEMVALPLLYPEVFQQFKITPPRGVLFHGPPGTGKTLLARALAASVSAQGRKVTFYMRKGADALSKWVGEAERQLRLLFEEARKNQPSIIFFDEIDGLAPVRSSKQEQIHASIVATLLALMDGMDGRGQVIVIGATNRPDSVDPALRRPGRFDREFYFPLPDKAGRRSILDIQTRGWDPPLEPRFKDQLAELTKGYVGADLRALCTEAALNAVQGTYPQIYKSNEKLVIDPTTIRIQPKDFMISINKMIPSSERSGASAGAPVDRTVEPLLSQMLGEISSMLDEVLPERPKRTALEEAEFDDRDDQHGFEREMLQQEFDKARIYRPRLLIQGQRGMGQQYLGAAVLHKYERLHVQSFDLPTLFNDATRTPEAAVVQLFNEVRRHKPCIIYLPNVNTWYETVSPSVIKVFSGLLRSLSPNDPVLVLGVMELESKDDKIDENMLRDFFGFSPKSQYEVRKPKDEQRRKYFQGVVRMIETAPTEMPGGEDRPKRSIPQLEVAPLPKAPDGPSKQELKARKKQDMHTLNMLKILIQPIMDHIKNKYRKFRHPTIDESKIGYLFDEEDPNMVTTDLPAEQHGMQRPFELKNDHKGIRGLYENATGKFYYNIEIVTIERRLSNGYYKRPKDFLADIRRLAKDAKTSGDEEKTLKANELVANVEVDIQFLETNHPALVSACEEVYSRETERTKQQKADDNGDEAAEEQSNKISGTTTTQTTGPILLGEPVPGRAHVPFATPTRPVQHSQLTNGDSTESHTNANSNGHSESHKEDVQMGESQDVQGHPSLQTQKSQRSALTTMAQNSQPGDYHNSASTTTSGQKTSDKSRQSWQNNTQSSNGIGIDRDDRPDFSGLKTYSGQSQLPDTQEMQHSSSQSQAASRAPAGLANILNETQPTPKLIVDKKVLRQVHEELVERSAGCSIEQLEQINAMLMDAVWRHRADWNRNSVIEGVVKAFNSAMAEIEQTQTILPNTQSSGRSIESDGA